MPIEPPQAEYRQVAAELRAAIHRGEYAPGSTLPGEPELAQRFGVGRATINRALSLLRTEGLIRPERGRGTTVNPLPMLKRDVLTGTDDLPDLPQRTDSAKRKIRCPAAVAEALAIAPGGPVLRRTVLTYLADIPVKRATSYVADQDAQAVGFYEETKVRPPQDDEARDLDLDADHRIYDIVRVARAADGQAIEVTQITLPVHQWALDVEWRAD